MPSVSGYFRYIYDTYLTAMKGLHVTMKVMSEKPATTQYPEQPTGVTPQFRGFHKFEQETCTGCGLCAKRCPVQCIAIEKVGKGKDAEVVRYAIDYSKCLFCSICCDACPKESIHMGGSWYKQAASRGDLKMEFVSEDEAIDLKAKVAEIEAQKKAEKEAKEAEKKAKEEELKEQQEGQGELDPARLSQKQ